MRRLLIAMCVTAMGVVLAGCAEEEGAALPCRDGYTAHPSYTHDQDGCGGHGGAVDEFKDPWMAYLDQLPKGQVVGEICADGWISDAVNTPGACSSHGGVNGNLYDDGTKQLNRPDGVTIIEPDGTVKELDYPR